MGYIVQHYIAGQLINETNTSTHPIYNPALGEIIGQVHFASKALCDKAIISAKESGKKWAEMPAIKRARILFKFRGLILIYIRLTSCFWM